MPDYYTRPQLSLRPASPAEPAGQPGLPAKPAGTADGEAQPVPLLTAGDVMAALVFSVQPETPARQVIEELVAWRIQRLFVVDRDGCLIGAVHTFDLLGRLLA
jgi:hypothetical protein